VLYTDHKPLEKLGTVHTKTLNRLQEKLQDFHFDIRYVKGGDNSVADFLSRSVGDGCAPVIESPLSIKDLQEADPETLNWIRFLQGSATADAPDPGPYIPRMLMDNGLLYIKMDNRKGIQQKNKCRLVAPKSMRAKLLKEGHDSKIAGHAGVFKTGERIKEIYWWPNMDADVADHLRRCQVCQKTTNKGILPLGPLSPLPEARKPNERVHIDLFGPLLAEDRSARYVCVMTDAFTKIVRLAEIPDKQALTVAECFINQWTYIYGVPSHLLSDQGTEFCNKLLKEVCTILRINRLTTTPYHPQTNAQAEVFNKTMKAYLTKMCSQAEASSLHWAQYLAPLMARQCTSPP
jgi:hypothetical protein